MKTALIYYSFSGNTKQTAEKIAELTGAELFRVTMHKEIPPKGFGKFFFGGMGSIFGNCPKINMPEIDFADYERIILGMPIWAGNPAAPINTLLKAIPDKNKITAVFTFSGGGDNDKCLINLRKKCPALTITAAFADKDNPVAEKQNPAAVAEFTAALNGEKNG